MSSFKEKSKTETNSHLLCVPLDWTALYFSQFGNNSSFLSFKILWNDTNFEISKFHKKKYILLFLPQIRNNSFLKFAFFSFFLKFTEQCKFYLFSENS